MTVQIDFDNISQRILALPLPPRRYVGLQTGKTGVLFAVEAPTPIPGTQTGPLELTVHRFDLKTRKSDVAIGGVRQFRNLAKTARRCYTGRATIGPSLRSSRCLALPARRQLRPPRTPRVTAR